MRERPLFMIVASTREGVIGRNGALPWTIPEDTEWFLSCVRGCTVISAGAAYHENGGTVPGCDDLIVVTRKARLAGARTASSSRVAAELARQTKSARPIWSPAAALYRKPCQCRSGSISQRFTPMPLATPSFLLAKRERGSRGPSSFVQALMATTGRDAFLARAGAARGRSPAHATSAQ